MLNSAVSPAGSNIVQFRQTIRSVVRCLSVRPGVDRDRLAALIEAVLQDYRDCRNLLRIFAGRSRTGSKAERREIVSFAQKQMERALRLEDGAAVALFRLLLPSEGRTRAAGMRDLEDDLLLCLLGILRQVTERRRVTGVALSRGLRTLLDLANIGNARGAWTDDAITRRVRLRGGVSVADLASVAVLSRDDSLISLRPRWQLATVPLAMGKETSQWIAAVLPRHARLNVDAGRLRKALERVGLPLKETAPTKLLEWIALIGHRCPMVVRTADDRTPCVPLLPA